MHFWVDGRVNILIQGQEIGRRKIANPLLGDSRKILDSKIYILDRTRQLKFVPSALGLGARMRAREREPEKVYQSQKDHIDCALNYIYLCVVVCCKCLDYVAFVANCCKKTEIRENLVICANSNFLEIVTRGAAFSSRLDLEIPKSRFSSWLDVEIPIEDILIQGFRKLVGAVILLPLTTWKGRFSHNSKNTKNQSKLTCQNYLLPHYQNTVSRCHKNNPINTPLLG